MRVVKNRFIPVILLGLYGVIASMLLLDEYFQRIKHFEFMMSQICFPCGDIFEDPYLEHSMIMGVSFPFLSTTLFMIIMALGLLGLVAGRNQIVSKASLLAILILSIVGVGGGAYLLYVMLSILKTLCPLCVSLDATLWMLTAYTSLRIFKHNQLLKMEGSGSEGYKRGGTARQDF